MCPSSLLSFLPRWVLVLIVCTAVFGEVSATHKRACGDMGVCECFSETTKSYVVNCSSKHLVALPSSIPNNVTNLDISRNILEDLPHKAFWETRNLTILHLSHNHLTHLPKDLFERTWYLQKLYLSHNRLAYLTDGLFKRICFVEILDLSNNYIKELPNDIFQQNLRLSTVQLSYNLLTKVTNSPFATNEQLNKVDISHNYLTDIQETTFANNTKLRTIGISHNRLEHIPENIFENNGNVVSVDLSNNLLRKLPKGLFRRNQKMEILYISRNDIHELPNDLLQQNLNLTKLYLSNNCLKNITNNPFANNEQLLKIDISHNQLTDIQENTFVSNVLLQKIHLSHNNIMKMTRNLFLRNSKLQTIVLGSNQLEELPEDLFENMSELEYLDLSNNSLKSLPAKLFERNANLSRIKLSYNNINEVPEQIFVNTSGLRRVDFVQNGLRNIPEGIFWNNTEVASIDFSGNLLRRIPDGLLLSVTKLQKLRLGENSLEVLPADLFVSVDDIQHLSLGNNKFAALDKTAFNGSTDLSFLNLYGNKLSSLPKDLFSDVNLAGIVDISSNELKEIPEGLFCSNKMRSHDLTFLLLNNNCLVYLSRHSFKGLHKLTHIFLQSNNIKTLDDNVFAEPAIKHIYIFSNNLTEISNKSFESGSLLEVQFYKNNIKNFTADAFNVKGSRVNLYLHCGNLTAIPLLNKNLSATCVTPKLIPKIKLNNTIYANLIEDGFNCTIQGDIHQCSPCPPGTYGDRQNHCKKCPTGGFYQDDFGRLHCKNCSVGVFVNHSGGASYADCELCPEGTNLARHAGHRACFCKTNYYRIDRLQGCYLCLEQGLNCSQDHKSLLPGYYWNWSFPDASIEEYSNFVKYLQNDALVYNDSSRQYTSKIPKVHKCPQQSNCLNKDSFTADGIQGNCKDGYRGWLCSKCKEGFYSVLNTCIPCPNKIWISLEVIAVICSGIGLYFFILWQNQKQKKKCPHDRSIVDRITSQLKIVLGFYQVVGELFESFHDVTWVGPLEFVGQMLVVLKVNILRVVVRPHCMSEKLHMNAKIQLIISLSFPLVICLLLMCGYLIRMFYLRYKLKNAIEVRMAKLNQLREKLFTYAVVLIFITYPPTCDVIFKLYPGACERFFLYENETNASITLLRSDFDLECETLKLYQIFAYVATGTYVVAFPCGLLFLLRKYSKTNVSSKPDDDQLSRDDSLSDSTVNERSFLINKNNKCNHLGIPVWLRFLSENYKPQFWYWEIIELARKVMQTVLVTLLGWEDALTKLLTIATSVLFITLHAKFSPMANEFEQRLQMFSLTAIFINVLVASVPIPYNYQAPISTILILMNMIIFLIIAGEIILVAVRFIRSKLSRRKAMQKFREKPSTSHE